MFFNDNLLTSLMIFFNKYSEINVRSDFVKKVDNRVFGLPLYGHLVNKFIDTLTCIIPVKSLFEYLDSREILESAFLISSIRNHEFAIFLMKSQLMS